MRKKKEIRYEKVVEYGDKIPEAIGLAISIAAIFSAWFTFEAGLFGAIFVTIIFGVLSLSAIVSIIQSKKVYWRKMK